MGDVYKNIDVDRMGNELKREDICNDPLIRCDPLEDINNVIGISINVISLLSPCPAPTNQIT